jgi:hypothetical protein
MAVRERGRGGEKRGRVSPSERRLGLLLRPSTGLCAEELFVRLREGTGTGLLIAMYLPGDPSSCSWNGQSMCSTASPLLCGSVEKAKRWLQAMQMSAVSSCRTGFITVPRSEESPSGLLFLTHIRWTSNLDLEHLKEETKKRGG